MYARVGTCERACVHALTRVRSRTCVSVRALPSCIRSYLRACLLASVCACVRVCVRPCVRPCVRVLLVSSSASYLYPSAGWDTGGGKSLEKRLNSIVPARVLADAN